MTTQSRSSRSATPQQPVSRHSHRYCTGYTSLHVNGKRKRLSHTSTLSVESQHILFYFLSKWTFLIRRLDLQMEALMTGTLKCFSLQPVNVCTVLECFLCQCTMTMCFRSGRDMQIESLKRDLELLRAELERVKAEVGHQRLNKGLVSDVIWGHIVKDTMIYMQKNLCCMLEGYKCCSSHKNVAHYL